MSNTTFDPRIEVGGVNLFKGEMTKLELSQAPALPHHVSNRAIDPGQPFDIDIEWQCSGAEVPIRMNAVGDWSVFAYAESMGPGPEIDLGGAPATVAKGPILPDLMTYSHTITIPANTLPEHLQAGASGVYKICVVVFANSTLPGPGSDIVGFGELLTVLAERPE